MKPELIVDAQILNKKKIYVKKIQKPHFDHPFHFHQFCELAWVEKGFGNIIIGDYAGNFSEGELIMVAPYLPHLWKSDQTFYQQKPDTYTQATGLYFPPELIIQMTDDGQSTALYKEMLTKAQRGLRFYGETRERAIEKIRALSDSEELEQMGNFLQLMNILMHSSEYQLLAAIPYKSGQNEEDMGRFNSMYQFLLENFHRDIRLSEVAGICNMGQNSFCKYFKQKTQKTFTRFLNELRIGQACILLQNSNNPIHNIGYECGYNNPVNFYKFFKLITQKTPKQYRMFFEGYKNHITEAIK